MNRFNLLLYAGLPAYGMAVFSILLVPKSTALDPFLPYMNPALVMMPFTFYFSKSTGIGLDPISSTFAIPVSFAIVNVLLWLLVAHAVIRLVSRLRACRRRDAGLPAGDSG